MIRLISFASHKYQKAAIRFEYEGCCIGMFDEIVVYSDSDFDDEYWQTYGFWIENNPRGHGYWIWKSYFALHSIREMNEGDILVYADVGCAINYCCKKKLQSYFDMISESELGLVCFENGYLEKNWDKGDALDYFACRGDDAILCSSQIMGGVWMIRVCNKSRKLLLDWFNVIHNNLPIVDDSPSKSPNEKGFKENRHDQTIFSLLVKKTGGAIVLPNSDVEVECQHRGEGWLAYRRYKNNVFLAIRDSKGKIYSSNSILVTMRNIACDSFLHYENCKKIIKMKINRLKEN